MKVLLEEKEIKSLIKELANKIRPYYETDEGKNLVVIPIMKGAIFFAADLLRELNLICSEIDFIRLASYQGNKSSGKVQMVEDITSKLEGKDILVIDEILDTGRTLNFLFDYLKKQNPKSLRSVCLLDKKECRIAPFEADFVGKVIPNHFVVGYGLDYEECYRTLPYIGIYEGD